jgi:hypothetical protein
MHHFMTVCALIVVILCKAFQTADVGQVVTGSRLK